MKDMYKILVVDDEYGMREGVTRVLQPYGYFIITAPDGKTAFDVIEKNSFDLALIDLKLPDADGLDILDAVQRKDPLTVCVIITAYATLDTAVDATKRGAFDYLAKPFTADQLLVLVDKALDRRDIITEADRLRKERDRSLLLLSLEQSRFKTIISCMIDGVIVTNLKGEVVLFNNIGSRFLKGGMGVEPGTPLADCMENEELREMITTASAEEKAYIKGKEIKIESETWMANCAVLRDDGGEFLGTVTVLRDISEIKELELMKSRFVSLVAHELRAPVAAIKGYLDIILTRSAGQDEKVYQKMMERSRERATGLLDLIKDLLDMSRIDTGKVQRHIKPVDVKDCLKNNIDFFKPDIDRKKLSVEMNLPDEPLSGMCDPDEFNRIITNLLSNAIKYNFEEGKIMVNAGKKGELVFFTIADTGIGMSAEDMSNLFQDFFRASNTLTRKETGTGLGLSITKRMVEANFGRIEVESQPSKGSRFTVILPSSGG